MNNNNKLIVAAVAVVVVLCAGFAIMRYTSGPQSSPAITNSTSTGTVNNPTSTNTGNFPQTYENNLQRFSIRYPANYTIDKNYSYQAIGVGKEIAGTKLTIDPAIAAGTNLSADTYLSVEYIPNSKTCTANLFFNAGEINVQPHTVIDAGTSYSIAMAEDAAAGNRYEETVYAIPGTDPCIGVRYFVHYGVLENYPTGTVTAYDSSTLISQFDAIRRTLTITQ